MFLIPLGPEDGVVRRHPVVCYGLAAVNVLAFALTAGFDDEQWVARMEEGREEIAAYVYDHPYLDVPASVAAIPPVARSVEEARAEAPEREPPVERLRALEQSQIDDMGKRIEKRWGERPAMRYGLVPAHPRPLAFLTSMFMHGGFGHLLGNMLFFYIAGPLLEDLYGRPLFLGLYLVSGVMGSALHLIKSAGSAIPVVGASGAIAGLMGAFLVRLASKRIRFLFVTFFMYRFVRLSFAVPAWVVIPFWFAEDFIVASGSTDRSGIAHAAHVGGFVFGAFAAFLIKVFAIESRFVHPAIEAAVELERPPGFLDAVEARAREDWVAARQHVDEALAAAPDDADVLMESYLVALGEGDMEAAARTAEGLIARYEADGDADLATALLEDCEKKLEVLPPELARRRRALLGDRPSPAGRPATELAGAGRAAGAGLMDLFREGEACRNRGDLAGAEEHFRKALAHPACNDSWKERLQGALDGLEGERGLGG